MITLLLTSCAQSKISDFDYRGTAHRVHSVAEDLGRVFTEQGKITSVIRQVERESTAETPAFRVWTGKEQNINWGGNWIVGIRQGATEIDVTADVLIVIDGSYSGEIFGSKSASIFLCVSYLGELGLRNTRAVEGQCPDGVEERLRSFHRVTIDQLVDYEVDE